MLIKAMSDKRLVQALSDAENEVLRLRLELERRARARHPKLFDAVRDATRKALSKRSLMERSRID